MIEVTPLCELTMSTNTQMPLFKFYVVSYMFCNSRVGLNVLSVLIKMLSESLKQLTLSLRNVADSNLDSDI